MAHPSPDLDLSLLPVTHREVISEDYIDGMGHMNVAWYVHLFNGANRGFYEMFGLVRSYMEETHSGIFALESHVRFLSEVKIGQRVTLRSRAIGRTQKRLHFVHFMSIDESDALAAVCEYVAAHIDMNVRRMSPILDPVAAGFDELLAEHRGLDWDPPLCGSIRS